MVEKKILVLFDIDGTLMLSGGAGNRSIDKACRDMGRIMDLLIEINSGEESQKTGVRPADAIPLIRNIAGLEHIKVMGLMTMGPFAGDPEESRPYFHRTKDLFEELRKLNIPGVEMRYLSMGMSNSYRIAIEEGSNMVRIGTRIFGERS